jgi:hypothetical protein
LEIISKAIRRMKEGITETHVASSSVMIYTQHVIPNAR